jgi:opacity protein-like surface antigen
MNFSQSFLTTISNPNLLFFLLALGVLGLYIEFSTPGLILPGVVGAISLILALIANILFDGDESEIQVDGDLNSLASMANAYFDVGTGAPLTLWLGAGVGYAKADVDLDFVDDGVEPLVEDDDGSLAFQFMTGATFNFARHFGLSARYTYFVADDFELTSDETLGAENITAEYETHNFMLGLVVKR